MKKFIDFVAYFFIAVVAVLSAVAMMGIWEMVDDDVIEKSFVTIALLTVVTVIVLVTEQFFDQPDDSEKVAQRGSVAVFRGIRKLALVVLLAAVSILALIGVLSIWEVLSEDIGERSIATIALLAFSALLIVLTCLHREGKLSFYRAKRFSPVAMIITFVVILVLLGAVRLLFWLFALAIH